MDISYKNVCGGVNELCNSIGNKYTDKWGEIWTRITHDLLRRSSDGSLGNWFNGQGLREINF